MYSITSESLKRLFDLLVNLNKRTVKAHRLVYAYFNGKFPEQEIDHINRIRSDNRIENLRDASRIENISNRTPVVNKDTGLVGVHFDRTNGLKRNFAFSKNGRTYRFRTALEAKTARERMLANEHL